MAALDEIVDLEHEIYSLTKQLSDVRLRLAQCDDCVVKIGERVAAANARVALHHGNRRYMRAQADYVDLGEWAKTQQHLAKHEDTLSDQRAVLWMKQSERQQLQQRIVEIGADISVAQVKLRAYGVVIEFPTKKAT